MSTDLSLIDFSIDPYGAQYAAQADQIAPGIVAQAQKIAQPGESIIDSISRAISTVVMADSQRQLLNVQLDRAKQGLPPLDVSQYAVGANLSLGVASGTQKLVIGVAAAIVLAFVLPRLLKGK